MFLNNSIKALERFHTKFHLLKLKINLNEVSCRGLTQPGLRCEVLPGRTLKGFRA